MFCLKWRVWDKVFARKRTKQNKRFILSPLWLCSSASLCLDGLLWPASPSPTDASVPSANTSRAPGPVAGGRGSNRCIRNWEGRKLGDGHCRQWDHHVTCWKFPATSFPEEETIKAGLIGTRRRKSPEEERHLWRLRGRPPTERLPHKSILMFVLKPYFPREPGLPKGVPEPSFNGTAAWTASPPELLSLLLTRGQACIVDSRRPVLPASPPPLTQAAGSLHKVLARASLILNSCPSAGPGLTRLLWRAQRE